MAQALQWVSALTKQLINLEKVRTDTLKFRTDLRDRVMDGWSVTPSRWMFAKADCYKNLKIKNWSSSSQRWSLVLTTWLSNIAVYLRPIWLQTLVAIDLESRLTSFPSFCSQLSEVAALFDSNLSRRFPRTGHQFRPAALHRIRFGTYGFVPMSYFYSETNKW